jgi:alpha-D-ribose 1-methylphosphonate 5-triphosphate synthase subunit PhnG
MLSRHLNRQNGAGDTTARQRWMGVLARADTGRLEALWAEHGGDARLEPVRPAEIGLVMVRGRAGGTGERFNLGEMTVTRAAVRAPDGTVGHGYVKGRAKRHAELAACFDALLQDDARRAALLAAVIEPLAEAEAERRHALAAKAAATKVDFFTMVRGDG